MSRPSVLILCAWLLLAAADEPARAAAPPKFATLAEALEQWIKVGGEIDKFTEPFDDLELTTRADANAVCDALEKLRAKPDHGGEPGVFGARYTLVAYFQQIGDAAPALVFRRKGLPLLRQWVAAAAAVKPASKEGDDDVRDAMLMLKMLAMYQQPEDTAVVVGAARSPALEDEYLWSTIFGLYDDEHDHTAALIDGLRNPLPKKFCRVAFLDQNTNLALAGHLKNHAFDTDDGRAVLEEFLRGKNPDEYSYAKSATAALAFLSAERRAALLPLAEAHADGAIRLEAAWVRGKTGDAAGIAKLVEYCRNPLTAEVAAQYLEELGRKDAVPREAQDENFKALAAMARWLEHPNEFGRLPDKIEILDTRELFWPPTNDKRRLWLVKYLFKGKPGEKDDEGVGMVGSITFALFGEATVDKRPEDIYALHCCWELESREDERAPKERSIAAGRKLLAEKNSGF